jgi:secreted Zn-dependent insulinase-like peptidase
VKVKPVLEGWYPKDVEKTKELYDRFKLRAVGPWSQSYLDNTEYAKTLAERHWEHVKKTLVKYMSKPPKNKREAEKMIKEALLSPEQRFLIMYEASLTRPLSPSEFKEYLELFKQVAPKAYEGLYGSKTPAQVAAEVAKQERIALKSLKITPS